MTIAQRLTSHYPCALQQTLNELGIWVKEHKMKLNSKQCKVLRVTHIKQIPAWPSLSINQNILKTRNSVKLLGVTSQSDLRWDGQVDHLLSSANRKLFSLRRLNKFGVRDQELVIIYTRYVRPVLEYAVPVWHRSLTTDQIVVRISLIPLSQYNFTDPFLHIFQPFNLISSQWTVPN